jgi:protein arginine N-methyltransferase 1
VDIGTGTGILAFFAATKRPRKIYAIEHSNNMLDYVRAAAKVNGITNISFVASNSISVVLQNRLT